MFLCKTCKMDDPVLGAAVGPWTRRGNIWIHQNSHSNIVTLLTPPRCGAAILAAQQCRFQTLVPRSFFQMYNVSKVYGMYKQTKLLKFQHKEKNSIVLDSWTMTSVLVYFQFQSQSLCFHAFQMSPKIISYFHKFIRKIITFL